MIKIEPAEFFMYRVILIFDMESPDSEDHAVRDYLAEHELEPRYQSTGELDQRQCEFLQFGGCYLGRHVDSIGQIQRKAVEVELLTAAIQGHLADITAESDGGDVGLTGQQQAAVTDLVPGFHQESSFQTAENGELIAVLDGEAVREAARHFAANTRGS